MNFENKYPYTDFHELNLDWIISEMKKLREDFETFKHFNTLKWGGVWDFTKNYSIWTIVTNDGSGYVSYKKPVPAGTQIDDTDYWLKIYDLEKVLKPIWDRMAAIEAAMAALEGKFTTLETKVTEQLEQFKTEINSMQTTINNLSTQVQELVTKVTNVENKVTNLETTVNNQTTEINNINQTITGQTVDISGKVDKLSPAKTNELLVGAADGSMQGSGLLFAERLIEEPDESTAQAASSSHPNSIVYVPETT